MNRLFVAAQNLDSREWVPVAELRQLDEGYELRYTQGATRVPGFVGFGRMQALDKIYHSGALFPFFSNRLIAKSRPEYRDYLRWLGLESAPKNLLEVLAISGGVRATDSFELVAPPVSDGELLRLRFFPRGLRYLPAASIQLLYEQKDGASLVLMKDVQNEKDESALAIRTVDQTIVLVGYVPRYYCKGIGRLLDRAPQDVKLTIQRVNHDAPLDMKLLLAIEAPIPAGFDLLDDVSDFHPLTTVGTEKMSAEILSRTVLDI